MNAFLMILALLLTSSARSLPDSAQTCLGCHSDRQTAPVPDLKGFDKSAHSGLDCAACHADASEMPHSKKPGPVDCGSCHPGPAQGLKDSTHGRAIMKRFSGPAACEACHGPGHQIRKIKDPKSPVFRANQPTTCGSCHGIPGKAATMPNGGSPLESYNTTVHGQAQEAGNNKAAACADCHGSHDVRAPGDPASKVSKANIAATCGACHKDEAAAYRASVHGKALSKGIREAPACTDCHGEHTIRSPKEPGSSVSRGAITRTCSGCHGSQRIALKFGLPGDRVATFMDSYHGLADGNGDIKVANCASCHGWHDVLPASDPKSRVNPANLATTCGQCHAGAKFALSTGKVHQALAGNGGASKVADLLRLFYLIIIPCTIGGMLFHNTADLLRKALTVPRLPPLKDEGDEILLSVSERVQHAFLAGSFFLLAFSGFALKFPRLWALVGLSRLGGETSRLWTHRGAALVFVLLGGAHAVYLLFTEKGRERLRALLPALKDIPEPLQLMLFNFGLSKTRPKLSRWSYIEKSEYWALLWGSGVMIATGAILIFHNFALAHFPLWVIESARVVHFMEAVLACLSILCWHGYWVVFDPDAYPMNWAWLTGRAKLGESHENKEDDDG